MSTLGTFVLENKTLEDIAINARAATGNCPISVQNACGALSYNLSNFSVSVDGVPAGNLDQYSCGSVTFTCVKEKNPDQGTTKNVNFVCNSDSTISSCPKGYKYQTLYDCDLNNPAANYKLVLNAGYTLTITSKSYTDSSFFIDGVGVKSGTKLFLSVNYISYSLQTIQGGIANQTVNAYNNGFQGSFRVLINPPNTSINTLYQNPSDPNSYCTNSDQLSSTRTVTLL
jgi:hypothetical protein